MARAHVQKRHSFNAIGAEKKEEKVIVYTERPDEWAGSYHARSGTHHSGVHSGQPHFEWAGPQVCVGAFGEQLIAGNGLTIRMSLEDCVLCASFLREEELALFLESVVGIERPLDVTKMTADAQRIATTENAGGSSELSEALSMEILHRVLGARLHKTEMELIYFTGDATTSKMTDFSIVLDGSTIGVSVSRACKGWPYKPGSYKVEDASRLLKKKLVGINESTRTVSNASWKKQLLHILVADAAIMPFLAEASAALAPELIANTIVLFTVCGGPHSGNIFAGQTSETTMLPANKKLRVSLGWKSDDHLTHLAASDPCARRIPHH